MRQRMVIGRLLTLALAAALTLALTATAQPPTATEPSGAPADDLHHLDLQAGKVIAIRRVPAVARQVAFAYDKRQSQIGRWRCGLRTATGRACSPAAPDRPSGDLRKRRYALEAVGSGGRKARYSSGAVAARVHRCRNSAGPTITITSTRNMLCRSAARVMRAHNRPISTSFKTSGYRCRRISGGALGGTWRCLKSNRGFRFAFGD
ncbi:MAG: hypothetical protein WKF40_01870 [Thermoleophilaceae bacterium]